MNTRDYGDCQDAIDRALAFGRDDLGAYLRLAYQSFLDSPGKKPESPIEHALAVAMISMSIAVPVFEFMEAPADSEILKRRKAQTLRAPVECQAKIGKFRVDFLIKVLHEQECVGSIVVECDGHDFHERTKAQAERDRSRDRQLTAAGYRVLRFTGSEIYRQPMSCAFDVIDVVKAVSEEKAG